MTWMTPFDAMTSAFTTVAPSTITDPLPVEMRTDLPLTVLALLSVVTSAAVTFPGTTW